MRLPALLPLALLGALVPAAPAGAVTRAGAAEKALTLLRPAKGNTAVFGLPAAVPKGTEVAAGVATGTAGRGVRLRRRAFLFWEDDALGARFSHPGELLLLDATTGRVVLRAPTALWPTVGGKVPAFLRSRPAYLGTRYRVDGGGARARAAAAVSPGRYRTDGSNGPFKVTKEHLALDCLVIVGDQGTTSTNVVTGNVRAMSRWARDVGMRAARAGPTPAKVSAQVDAFVASGCRDVFIFLTGHGQPGPGANVMGVDNRGLLRREQTPKGGQAAVITDGLDVTGPPTDPTLEGDKITPADLQGILRRYPSIEFKIKIDACFSGRFWEPLTGRPWNETSTAGKPAPYPNLRVLEVSSAPNEVSYAQLEKTQALRTADGKITRPNEDPLDNPDGATYFTNANLHGLYAWARDPGTVDEQVPRGAPPSFPRGLSGAFEAGKAMDIPRAYGLTHPRRQALPPLETPTMPGTPATPVLDVALSWRHIGPGASEVCVTITGAAAGASLNISFSGVKPTGATAATVAADGAGTATARFPIGAYGGYQAEVSGAAGRGSGSTTVSEAQGTCPPP